MQMAEKLCVMFPNERRCKVVSQHIQSINEFITIFRHTAALGVWLSDGWKETWTQLLPVVIRKKGSIYACRMEHTTETWLVNIKLALNRRINYSIQPFFVFLCHFGNRDRKERWDAQLILEKKASLCVKEDENHSSLSELSLCRD